MNAEPHIGRPTNRVDGPLKVTGAAQYAGEFTAPDLLHGRVVSSRIAKGRVVSIDIAAALAVPGVVQVFTHENRRGTAWLNYNYQDDVAPPGAPFRPLYDEKVLYSGQPIALVVAEDFNIARYAASLVKVEYEAEEHVTDLAVRRAEAYVPPKKRSGINPPPAPRGDAEGAFTKAAVHVVSESHQPTEYHNPMEPHASTVVWEGEGKLTIYDKIQGVQNSQKYVTNVFGLKTDDVRVISPFVGGAFGAGLRPQYQLFLAVMAALELKRSVRVVLTRDQMFTFSYRPEALQTVILGSGPDGKLQSIRHEAIESTSTYEDYQETVVNWSGLMYDSPNAKLTYKLAKLDAATPADMRAPGATTGVYALETAMDELAYAAGIDPVELRLKNYSEKDENDDKPYTSKELRECYRQGAERIGWSRRTPEPRSMREGKELVGLGMATGCWEAFMQKASASAKLTADGRLEVATATADMGTGTYTILTQIAADAFGLPLDQVTAKLGDTDLPASPISGGSWTAASNGSAVQAACYALREQLFNHARGIDGSPLANADLAHVVFANGRIALASDPGRFVTLSDALKAAGVDQLSAEETAGPNTLTNMRYAAYTHSAIFVEVRVDEELGVVRVTRIVNAVAAGKILNPKTAASQVIGGVVMGLGMALQEEGMVDHHLGRVMNHNLGEYHVPVNADIRDIDVIFVEEHDDKVSPLGVKGLGEIGIVGTAAAITNAVYHATGKRIRNLPVTIDKLLG
jgi:xanthine dehydrogenase YagR molybdenum-binding subunit